MIKDYEKFVQRLVMKPLVEFALDDGSSILIEVEDLPRMGADEGLVSIPGQQIIVKAQKSFSDALEKIKPTAATIVDKVRSLPDPPDEVEVKFGIKMAAEARAVVAAASLEGNYEITLKWKKKD